MCLDESLLQCNKITTFSGNGTVIVSGHKQKAKKQKASNPSKCAKSSAFLPNQQQLQHQSAPSCQSWFNPYVQQAPGENFVQYYIPTTPKLTRVFQLPTQPSSSIANNFDSISTPYLSQMRNSLSYHSQTANQSKLDYLSPISHSFTTPTFKQDYFGKVINPMEISPPQLTPLFPQATVAPNGPSASYSTVDERFYQPIDQYNKYAKQKAETIADSSLFVPSADYFNAMVRYK